jgi:hypothetical protein
MKKLLFIATMVAAGLAVLPATANALNLTSSGSRTLTGNLRTGTSAIFVGSGSRITCTTHTIRILTTDISTIGNTRSGSTATSAIVRAANNTYTSSNSTSPPLCDYTFGVGSSGLARVTVNSDWILTAELGASTITLPTVTNNITIAFIGGSLDRFVYNVDAQSLRSTVSSNGGRTILTLDISDRTVAATRAGTSGTFTQTDTLVIPTAGLS